jgi:hypothetical protein
MEGFKVFEDAKAAQEKADALYLEAKKQWTMLQAYRQEDNVSSTMVGVISQIVPVIKKYLPAVAGAGGVGAVLADPALVTNIVDWFGKLFTS